VKLPLYEFFIAGRYGIHEARIINKETEFFPVILNINFAEILHNLHRV